METKPKLLFLYEHHKPEWWLDGLSAALGELEKDFDVTRLNLVDRTQPLNVSEYTFVLGWGGFHSYVDKVMQNLKGIGPKLGLCVAGNAFPPDGALNYDVLFYETKWYRDQINFHPNIVQAFGVNTDIFCPIDYPTPVVWDYIGVGALATWKRWDKFNSLDGQRLVVGQYQRNNEEESSKIAIDLIKNGVMVSDVVSPYDLAALYLWSSTAYIPADILGGGERAVLEARACGLKVKIEEDNPKLLEVLEGPLLNHKDYATSLKKGIFEIL